MTFAKHMRDRGVDPLHVTADDVKLYICLAFLQLPRLDPDGCRTAGACLTYAGKELNPEDVPVAFARETITLAATSFLMASTKTHVPELSSGYAQLFCFLAAEVLRAELANSRVGTAEIMADFHARLGASVPDDLRREFLSLSPDEFDTTWSVLKDRATQDQVDMEELADALSHINAVMSFFTKMREGRESEIHHGVASAPRAEE